ncbi:MULTISPECIES: hypothetical protein [unclassified Nocardia]|uniref:hypothetical protein n=1 Tax=unclassified Nocardia TaxID=2637762 RepID=UPI00278C4274|nr:MULTISPECIES: hypothetical protein [unclassified Nocardia]
MELGLFAFNLAAALSSDTETWAASSDRTTPHNAILTTPNGLHLTLAQVGPDQVEITAPLDANIPDYRELRPDTTTLPALSITVDTRFVDVAAARVRSTILDGEPGLRATVAEYEQIREAARQLEQQRMELIESMQRGICFERYMPPGQTGHEREWRHYEVRMRVDTAHVVTTASGALLPGLRVEITGPADIEDYASEAARYFFRSVVDNYEVTTRADGALTWQNS